MKLTDKKLLPVLIVLICTVALVVYFMTKDSASKNNAKGTLPVGGIRVNKSVSEQTGMLASFKKLFNWKSAGKIDLSQGADDPKYKELVDKIDRLYEDFGMLPKEKQDEKKLLIDQSALVIDYQLGPNHPKKKEFLEIVGWSHDKRQPLNKEYLDGKLTRQDFFKQLGEHMDEVGNRYASIFTDEEYKAMFNLAKGESLADTMGIAKGMADTLDRAERLQPKGPLSKDDYRMTESETMTQDQQDKFKKTYGDKPDHMPLPKEHN